MNLKCVKIFVCAMLNQADQFVIASPYFTDKSSANNNCDFKCQIFNATHVCVLSNIKVQVHKG